jgi:hypothetical protein
VADEGTGGVNRPMQGPRSGLPPGRRAWAVRRVLWMSSWLLSMGLCMLIAWCHGASTLHAIAGGALVGSWLLSAAFGAAEMVAPRLFLRWRRAMLEAGPQATQFVAESSEKLLLGHGGVDWDGDVTRVRFVGLAVILSATLATGLVWFVWVTLKLV